MIISCTKIKSFLLEYFLIGLIFVMFPSLFLIMQFKELRFANLAVVMLSFGSCFCAIIALLFLARKHPVLRVLILHAAALYYVLLTVLVGYRLFVGVKFNWYFLLDSLYDAIPTALAYLGKWHTLLVISILVVVYVLCWLLWRHMCCAVHACASSVVRLCCDGMFLCLVLIMLVFHMPTAYGLLTYNNQGNVHANRQSIPTYFPDHSQLSTQSRENVFIVQMESGNGLALSGKAIVDGKAYEGDYMPNFMDIAKDGVFFPYLWGNAMQTHRGQASILCGIAGNIGKPFHYRSEEIPTPCLPELLRSSGYSTVFLRPAKNPKAQNMNYFASAIGMGDVRIGDIMHTGDSSYGGFYEDSVFIERSFDYLKSQYPDPEGLFVYLELNTNHVPFNWYRDYDGALPFDSPSNFIEKYLNGAYIQDYGLAQFYKKFQEYSPENTHLIILADHSYPVGINGNTANEYGAYAENFLMPFVYVPPRNRNDEFSIGVIIEDPVHSQTDIVPTIFELLNGTSYQNSFVYDMHQPRSQTPYSYDMCHVLAQPYDGMQIAVVKGLQKYTYNISTGVLYHADLSTDLLELERNVVGENVSYTYFLDHYYCSRYLSVQDEDGVQPSLSSEHDTASYSLDFGPDAGPAAIEVQRLSYKPLRPFTVEATVQLRDTDSSFIVSAMQGEQIGIDLGVDENGYWFFGMNDGTNLKGVRSQQRAQTGATVHIAGAYSSGQVRLYVNGISQGTERVRTIHEHFYRPFFVGAVIEQKVIPLNKPASVFHGSIDEIRFSSTNVYDVDFTPPINLVSDKNTLVLFHFDEGQGDITHDSSGNNHNGNLVVGEKTHFLIQGIQWVPQISLE